MAVTMADITKLRKLSGAGMMDCKNALAETDGDLDKAMEIIRKKGQAVAAKRSDRDASEGCVVAKNADFVALTNEILDAAIANKCATLDEVNALPLGNGTIADAVTGRSGITGEKMELDGYFVVEGESTSVYNHQGKNQLCTIVAFNKPASDAIAHELAMQIAAMNPISVDEASVPASVVEAEMQVAIEKTKEEQVKKAVEAALKKAGFNLYIAENEEHLNEGIMKGSITEAQAEEIRQLKESVAAEKAANLPEQMIQNIAKGRIAKFYKEVCLLNQEDIMDPKKTVAEVLKEADPELKVLSFKRFTLRAE